MTQETYYKSVMKGLHLTTNASITALKIGWNLIECIFYRSYISPDANKKEGRYAFWLKIKKNKVGSFLFRPSVLCRHDKWYTLPMTQKRILSYYKTKSDDSLTWKRKWIDVSNISKCQLKVPFSLEITYCTKSIHPKICKNLPTA